ncbi:MAG: TIGR01777 family oxidoreductase [Acidimicrobiales bacterium]
MSGSHGLIGGALVAHLQADGHSVHRVVRSSPGIGDAFLDLPARRLDLSRLPGGSLDRIDAVFNLSGERITPTRWSSAKRGRLLESRVVVTDLIARAIAAADTPPTTFVSASAVGIYGERGDEELDEMSAPGEGFLAHLCREWERATEPARHANVRVVHARTGFVVAQDSPLIAYQLPLFRLGLGATLGNGRQWLSWIALADEVGALIHVALRAEIEGACNLTAPNPVRYREFASALARSVNRRVRIAVPSLLIEALIGSENAKDVALVSERVRPGRLLDSGYEFKYRQVGDAIAAVVASGTSR